jgi:hypothetical protein
MTAPGEEEACGGACEGRDVERHRDPGTGDRCCGDVGDERYGDDGDEGF